MVLCIGGAGNRARGSARRGGSRLPFYDAALRGPHKRRCVLERDLRRQALDTTKHTYNQAFAIYALSAYYRLTKNADALALARSLFEAIESHCTDAGGYLEAFTIDWQPESNEKLSENGVMATRTMNTLLHVFELRRSLRSRPL